MLWSGAWQLRDSCTANSLVTLPFLADSTNLPSPGSTLLASASAGAAFHRCTGHSRAGIHRLPQAASKAASLSLTARGRASSSRASDYADGMDPAATGNGSSISGFSLISSDPAAIGATRAWEAGTVAHASNFVSACRSVRPTDVPRGSKWAAVSFFENDPKEVSRHMQVCAWVGAGRG